MKNILDKVEKYTLIAALVLIPLLVIPFGSNPFITPKLILLFVFVSIILLTQSLKIITSGRASLKVSALDFSMFLLLVSVIASFILRTTNKMEGLVLPGTVTILVSSILSYFLVNQIDFKDKKSTIKKVFSVTAGLYSLILLASYLGVFSKIPQLPVYFRSQNFSPDGGYLTSALFLLTILPISLFITLKEEKTPRKIFFSVMLLLTLGGFLLSVYNSLPGRPNAQRMPDFRTSWYVTIDTLKESPLLGAGPGNYLTAFNRFKPLSYNQTENWALKFSFSRSYVLNFITETGLLGLASLFILFYKLYKSIRENLKENSLVGWGIASSSEIVSLGISALILILLPANLTLIFYFFIFASLAIPLKKSEIKLTSDEAGFEAKIPALIVSLPIIIFVIYSWTKATTYIQAEQKFRQSVNLLSEGKGGESYTAIAQALRLNPQVDRYHISASQINLILANALASSDEITDEQRTTIATLVQQAIQEGKAAVALNSLRSGNWENLGRIYRSIVPLANGADVFAAQTVSQAIALEPLNPNLRITLGGLYYAAGNYETAIRVFELATSVKPDLANTHYNLAYAYKEAGRLNEAINQMSVVLSLVDRDTKDYEAAVSALEQLQEKQKELTANTTENLNPPQESPDQILVPPLDLPEGSQPPESPVTPTPTPESSETTVTPTP